MKALLIGGTRFIGRHTAGRLRSAGCSLTFLRRGTAPNPFPGAREVLGDRSDPAVWKRLPRGVSWDLAVDFCAYREAETRLAVQALSGRVGRYVNISTGQVYLVLDPRPVPSRERDFEGRLMARPEGGEGGAWDYGVDKRRCEEALFEAGAKGFPFTTLRLPVVQGPHDPKGRLHAYVRRVLDGGPLLLPKERSGRLRHLYAGDAAACVAGLLGSTAGLGEAFNLAMEEDSVTLPELCAELFRVFKRRARVLQVPRRVLSAAGVDESSSPLSGSWISFLDPSKARRDLGFRTTPWRTWLAESARWAAEDPALEGLSAYSSRAAELALARRL